jgi:hypothetical protein
MVNTVGSLGQFKISKREKEIILGSLLGDAYLAVMKNSVRFEVSHSENQKEYIFWKYNELKKFVRAKPRRVIIWDKRYRKEYRQWRFRTQGHEFFAYLYSLFYSQRGKKFIPQEISLFLDSPLSLAVWFMDDGGRRNDCYGMFLNTLSFTKKENELLRKCLKRNFFLDSRLHWVQDGYRLYIPSSEAKYFCELIYPYIIPAMRYKLSYDPVTTSFAQLDRARDRRKKPPITRRTSSEILWARKV